tara:strand:+ start:1194 stop:1376 length:183 start_codon:yes stop_codon:yes gene_type:complete
MNFKNWLKKVDDLVFNKLDLHLKDLPDEDFWVNYDNKMTCVEMADKIIKDQYKFLSFMTT